MKRMCNVTFLLGILLAGCKNEGQKKTVVIPSTIEIINVDTAMSSLNLSSLVSSIEYVPLETTEDNTIGKIDKLVLSAGRFFILDKKNSRSLFVFDSTGKFFTKKESEKNELARVKLISDFSIDNKTNTMYLLAGEEKSILVFSLPAFKFKKTINIKGYFSEIVVTGSNSIFLLREGNDFKDSYGNFKVCQFDSTGQITGKWINDPVNPYLNGPQPAHTGVDARTGSFLFSRTFGDTIYKANHSLLTVSHVVKTGRPNPPELFNTKSQKTFRKLIEDASSNYISSLLYDSDTVLYSTIKWNEGENLLEYNKRTHKTTFVRYINNDIDHNVFPFMSFMDDFIVVSILPAAILQQYYNLNSKTPDFATKYKSLIEINKKINHDSNPVLVLGKRKS